jgi:hypothetical protein
MVRVPIFSYLNLKTASLSEHSKSLLDFGFPLDLRRTGTAHPLGEPLYVVEPGAPMAGADPNCRALTTASTVKAGVASNVVSGRSSTAGAGSGVLVAGMRTLLYSA